jgi:predicted branched-subunit amino acid permease
VAASTSASSSVPALYLTWNSGTAVGLVLGNVIGDPNRIGLDAAFPALFLALLVPQLAGRRAVSAALLGGGIALALIPFAPAGVPVIAGAAACLAGWNTRPTPQGSAAAEDGLP